MSPRLSALIHNLHATVGSGHVQCEGDLSAYELDWRKRARGKALAVVRPACTAEVAAIVKACVMAGVSVVPQGGNTGLVGGSIPDQSGQQVVLSLQRMTAVRALDVDNLTVTVEAGCILQNLQEEAKKSGLLFPLSLAAEGSCTLGGNLATNAGGTQVLRYGNARELCLGLEVVTAQGEVWAGLSGLRKDNTGYDLRDLFIGSEGTLGIITAATLKLYPLPTGQLTAWATVPSMAHALALLSLTQGHLGASLTGFEVMGSFALSLVTKHFPTLRMPFYQGSATASTSPSENAYGVLLETAGHESESHARERLERLLENALAQGHITNAVVAESLQQSHHLWQLRESIPLAQAEEGLNIKHDISLPVSRIPAFVETCDALLKNTIPGVRLVNFGHLGDGNLHYNVQAPEREDASIFLHTQEDRVNTLVYDLVAQFGGSFSAEHGIGDLKRDTLERYKSPVAIGLMKTIKAALDPAFTLNPNRVLRSPFFES